MARKPSNTNPTVLLPCPFCGSPAELERDSDHHGSWFNLGCSRHWGRVDPDDKCPGGRIWYTDPPEEEAKAITQWNSRATAAALRQALWHIGTDRDRAHISALGEGWKTSAEEAANMIRAALTDGEA